MRLFVAFSVVFSFLFIPLQSHLALGDQYGRTGSLVLLIKADKRKYEVGEPIYITITVKNHTREPLFVNKRLTDLVDLKWDVFAESYGNMKMRTGITGSLTKDDFLRLEINEIFEKRLHDFGFLADVPILAKGRYAVRLSLEQKEEIMGPETWTGKAVTNLIWIEVKAPKKI